MLRLAIEWVARVHCVPHRHLHRRPIASHHQPGSLKAFESSLDVRSRKVLILAAPTPSWFEERPARGRLRGRSLAFGSSP